MTQSNQEFLKLPYS